LNFINYIWNELLKLNEDLPGNCGEESRFELNKLSLEGAKRIYIVKLISGCLIYFIQETTRVTLKDTDKLLMKIFRRNSLE